MKRFLFAALVLSSLATLAATGPEEWAPVHRDKIAAWKLQNSAPNGIALDFAGRSVRVLAEATGLADGVCAEFTVVGPLSDRAYEAFLITVASPADIAAALETVGVPRGECVNSAKALFHPYGQRVSITFKRLSDQKVLKLSEVMSDSQDKKLSVLERDLVYTGGERAADGSVVASTNIPCAVLANYNCSQSLFQFAAPLSQSEAYGSFLPRVKGAAGDLYEMVIAWDGKKSAERRTLKVKGDGEAKVLRDEAGKEPSELFAGPFVEAAKKLRESCGDVSTHDYFLLLELGREVKLSDAIAYAKFCQAIDGTSMRVNGIGADGFYYRAYLPDEKWLNRAARIAQPFEIHVGADGKKIFTFVEEDWSGEGVDPILKPHDTEVKDWSELKDLIAKVGKAGAKMSTVFIYLPVDSTIAPAYDIKKALGDRIDTYYIFAAGNRL